jgi:hypothetical protein
MLDRAHQLGSENEDDVRIAKRRGAFFCVLADFGELSPKFRGGGRDKKGMNEWEDKKGKTSTVRWF